MERWFLESESAARLDTSSGQRVARTFIGRDAVVPEIADDPDVVVGQVSTAVQPTVELGAALAVES